jgi:type I restriction enzyme ecoAI specificity protein
MDTKKLRQKILDLAIHGKLVPQDPNDEPASVLLERIRAEKERLIKEEKIKRSRKSAKTSDTPHYEQDMPFEVPKGWVWTTLEEITSKIGSGSTPKGSNYSEEGIPFFRSQNVYNEGLVYEDIKFISDATHQLMIGTEVHSKDLLLNITGGSLGRCAIVPADFQIGNVSQHVCIIRSILVRSSYVHTFILSPFFKKTMNITGSGREGLPKYNLEKMFLPIPPLKEQERIIKEIEHWFTFIDAIEQSKVNLQTAIKQTKSKILDLAIHGKLVPQDPSDEPALELLKRINPKAQITCDNEHYPELPKGWIELKIGMAATYTNGRAFKPEEWMQEGLPIIRIQNLNDNTSHYNRTTKTYEARFLVKNSDLLFAWAASLGTYIWEGGNAWLNQHIFKVEPYFFVNKKFLYYAFKAMVIEFYRNSHGSGMVHITKNQFENINLLLPPLEEQKRIVNKIEELFAALDTIEQSLQA